MVCPHRAWQRIMSLVIQAMPERGAVHGEDTTAARYLVQGAGPRRALPVGLAGW